VALTEGTLAGGFTVPGCVTGAAGTDAGKGGILLAQAAVFGVLITLMGCYQGYNSKGGAQGVGAATTSAVVAASVLILAFDYVLTELFFAR
jgi:ABC-type transporter Mla maintaining outer membrane lipid asymmetry permease subunit MlaE